MREVPKDVVRETESEVPMEAWPEIKHMVSEELFSLPSSPRVFVNNEDAQLVDMEGEAGHVSFEIAEIQEIFEDAVGTNISDEDGARVSGPWQTVRNYWMRSS